MDRFPNRAIYPHLMGDDQQCQAFDEHDRLQFIICLPVACRGPSAMPPLWQVDLNAISQRHIEHH
jgi:hypothetical protein